MTTTDYIINGVLILLVLRQIREQRLDLVQLVLPLALVFVAAHHFLRAIPSGGNDLVLVVGLALTGAAMGFLCAASTHMRVGSDGFALARAGWIAAALWVVGIGTRMAFAFLSSHGLGPAIRDFSAANHITSGAAWTAAFVLMALAEVTARVVTLHLRAQRMTHGRVEPLAAGAARI